MIHRMDPPADPDREPMPARLRSDAGQAGAAARAGGGLRLRGQVGRHQGASPTTSPAGSASRAATSTTSPRSTRSCAGWDVSSARATPSSTARSPRSTTRAGPSFELLQHRMHLTREADIKRRSKDIPVRYLLFDVLYLEGRSVMDRPYEERRELLESLELEGPSWQTPRYHRGEGKALLEASAEGGLEGVVAKRLDSTYSPGRRSPHWIKVKNKRRARLVIAGWLPEKERADRLGALLVGYFDGTATSATRGASAPASTQRSGVASSACWLRWRVRALPSRASAGRAVRSTWSPASWPRPSSRSGPTTRCCGIPRTRGWSRKSPSRSSSTTPRRRGRRSRRRRRSPTALRRRGRSAR